MSKDDILQALRLTAMGRCGHPLQEELAEKLAAVFAAVLPVELETPSLMDAVIVAAHELPGRVITGVTDSAPKRGPGRPKKAE